MDNRSFSLTKLLHDILQSNIVIKRWQDFEQLVVQACKTQDPNCIHNTDTDPDVLLSNGLGIEAKSTSSLVRGINLNSAAPNPNTFYVIAHYRGRVQHVAIVSGASFYCSEIDEIQKVNTSLQTLSNPYIRYRTRIMWQMKSPFEIWGIGNFIVNQRGQVIHQ